MIIVVNSITGEISRIVSSSAPQALKEHEREMIVNDENIKQAIDLGLDISYDVANEKFLIPTKAEEDLLTPLTPSDDEILDAKIELKVITTLIDLEVI